MRRTGFWGSKAAGAIFLARDTGRILLPFRSGDVQEPHTWGVWGGAIDEGEDPAQAVEREIKEESGYRGRLQLVPLYVFRKGTFAYHNFLAIVDTEFTPRLNWETEAFKWVEFGDWPSPLHFGLATLIKKSGGEIRRMIQELQTEAMAQRVVNCLIETKDLRGFMQRAGVLARGNYKLVPGTAEAMVHSVIDRETGTHIGKIDQNHVSHYWTPWFIPGPWGDARPVSERSFKKRYEAANYLWHMWKRNQLK